MIPELGQRERWSGSERARSPATFVLENEGLREVGRELGAARRGNASPALATTTGLAPDEWQRHGRELGERPDGAIRAIASLTLMGLRAGKLLSRASRIVPDPPELVADAIAFAIRSGEAHILVADPPRPITPGDSEDWGALLARQAPRPGNATGEERAR